MYTSASIKIEPKTTSSNSGGVAQRRRLIFNRQDSNLETQHQPKAAHVVYNDSAEELFVEEIEKQMLTQRSNASLVMSQGKNLKIIQKIIEQ